MRHSFRFSAIAALSLVSVNVNAQHFKSPDEAYNPDEERGSFDWVTKPYPIPVETTTYVDFFFNLPDDLPDFIHITLGEIVNSQPEHLHHFVLTGCPFKIDPSQEGLPNYARDCTIPLGAWAPGADVFGNLDLDTGVLLGKGLGIESVQLNVHYTDGVYANEAEKTLKMATDGIRVHYTTDFRPFTIIDRPIINIGSAPQELVIPSGESRFFVSKTCEVDTKCKDVDSSILEIFAYTLLESQTDMTNVLDSFADLSCEALQPLCNSSEEIARYILQVCPASCGLCEKGTDGAVNPLNPDSYQITAIQYHAHLLGREMYATLIREEDDPAYETTDATQKQTQTSKTIATDLESRPFWIFDFQESIPFNFGVEGDSILRGAEIKPGDKIQATCVYDATYRDAPTIFHLSTYDEMCITTTKVTFETPISLITGESNAASALTLAMELDLMTFSCKDGPEYDVYSGILNADEDGRDVWKNHPIEDAEGCTFQTLDIYGGTFTYEIRNCDSEDPLGCGNVEFLSDANAGAICTGGIFDQQDANAGVTKEACENAGGVYGPYDCEAAANFVNSGGMTAFDQDTQDLLVNSWWRPKCCGSDIDSEDPLGCGNVEFLSDANAGAICTGGIFDQQDANAGVTKEACENAGGVYGPYDCEAAANFVNSGGMTAFDQDTQDLLVNSWWRPKCCGSDIDSSMESEDNNGEELSTDDSKDTSSAPYFAAGCTAIVLLSFACFTTILLET